MNVVFCDDALHKLTFTFTTSTRKQQENKHMLMYQTNLHEQEGPPVLQLLLEPYHSFVLTETIRQKSQNPAYPTEF